MSTPDPPVSEQDHSQSTSWLVQVPAGWLRLDEGDHRGGLVDVDVGLPCRSRCCRRCRRRCRSTSGSRLRCLTVAVRVEAAVSTPEPPALSVQVQIEVHVVVGPGAGGVAAAVQGDHRRGLVDVDVGLLVSVARVAGVVDAGAGRVWFSPSVADGGREGRGGGVDAGTAGVVRAGPVQLHVLVGPRAGGVAAAVQGDHRGGLVDVDVGLVCRSRCCQRCRSQVPVSVWFSPLLTVVGVGGARRRKRGADADIVTFTS